MAIRDAESSQRRLRRQAYATVRATRPCGSSYNRCQPDTGVIARPPTASGRRQATGASRRASVARGAAAAATSGEIAAAPAPVTAATKMAADEGPVAALLRDGLDAEAPAEPAAALRQSVNTSWDASAERAALRDNLNAYLTREAAA